MKRQIEILQRECKYKGIVCRFYDVFNYDKEFLTWLIANKINHSVQAKK